MALIVAEVIVLIICAAYVGFLVTLSLGAARGCPWCTVVIDGMTFK